VLVADKRQLCTHTCITSQVIVELQTIQASQEQARGDEPAVQETPRKKNLKLDRVQLISPPLSPLPHPPTPHHLPFIPTTEAPTALIYICKYLKLGSLSI